MRPITLASRRVARTAAVVAAAVAGMFVVAVSGAVAATVNVCPTVESTPSHSSGDSVDDAAIFIHPADASKSLVVSTDKTATGGEQLLRPDGTEQAFVQDGRQNNNDLRYNFPLGGRKVTLLGASNRVTYKLDFYTVNADQAVTRAGSPAVATTHMPRGFAMYHSPRTGVYYAFVSYGGYIEQYELDGSSGQVTMRMVRQLQRIGTSTEGLVADDETGLLYASEEDIGGVWKFGAEPTDPITGTRIITTTENGGPIVQDAKGLAIYYAHGGRGYLIVASQGASAFHVFDRQTYAHLGAFTVGGTACSIDAVNGEDGIDVTNFPMGSQFPQGMFVTGDFTNSGPSANQNNKFVQWERIAQAFTPALLIDTTWDPRAIGADTTPDTIDPAVTLTAPAEGATLSGAVPVSATASDEVGGSGVRDVVFTVDGTPIGSDAQAPYSLTWNTATATNGTHTIVATATDNAGNAASSTAVHVSVSNVIDTTPPAVNVTSPTASATVSGMVTLSADAVDEVGGSGVGQVAFSVDGAVVGSDTTAPYAVSWNSTALSNGQHTVVATATDKIGNSAPSAGLTFTTSNPSSATITRRVSWTAGATTGTPFVTIPSTVVVGDVLLVSVATSSSSAVFATPPAGWTRLASTKAVDFNSAVWWHVVQASDVGATVAFPSGKSTDYWVAGAVAYANVDAANPIVGSTGVAPSSLVLSVTPGPITLPAGATAVSFAAADVSSVRTWTQNGGAEVFDVRPNNMTMAANETIGVAAGPASRTFTISGAAQELVGYIVGLRPR